MSFFYLKPAEGKIQLHDLQKCIFQRFEHIKLLVKGENVNSFNEYMIENSSYDNIGHFSLILMAVLSENHKLIHTVLEGEQLLFAQRLNFIQQDGLRHLCKSILKELTKESLDIPKSYKIPLQMVCQKLIIKHLAQHIKQHNDICENHNIRINFSHCLKLVSKREVELNEGKAIVPCSKWIKLLTHLYKSHLNFTINKARTKQSSKTDPRWKEIIAVLNEEIYTINTDRTNLKCNEIDEKSKTFPPCMNNLHSTLRNKHRLSHNQRFVYSLFLKDIGLPLQDAIDFWQIEYSKPHENSACVHSWTESSKKYVYGIRHLYGLEGSRRNYSTPNCSQLQANSSECVCPFKNFDKSKMLVDLDAMACDDISSDIEQFNFSKACYSYRSAIMKKINSTNDKIYSPVDYYLNV